MPLPPYGSIMSIDLSISEGVELLRGLGVAGDEALLREAAKRCNGHALSLTLLGTLTLLKENSVGLATLLKDPEYTQLWEGRIEEKLLEKIFNNLPGLSRGLLCAFSIYREAVPVEAALAVLTNRTKGQVLAILDSLLEQHLVQSQPASGHYQVHPIVAAYARRHFFLDETAGGEPARKAAHARAAHYYMQIAAAKNASAAEAKGIRDAEPLIEAVWQMCQEGEFQEAYELMQREDLFSKLSLWGANTVLLELCQLLLSGNWAYTQVQKAFLFSYVARTSNVLGKKQEALGYYEQALRIGREVGDRGGEGTTLNNLGGVYNDLGKKQEALGYYEQALRIRREVGDRGGEGTTLNNLGGVYDDLGKKQEALGYYEQALRIYGEVGDRGGEGTTLNNLGGVYNALGKKQEALGYYEQALRIRREVGDRGGEGTTLNNLGRVYNALGKKQEALGYYEQALRIREKWEIVGGREPRSTTWAACTMLWARSRRRWATTSRPCAFGEKWEIVGGREPRSTTWAACTMLWARSRRRWATTSRPCAFGEKWEIVGGREPRSTTWAACTMLWARSRRRWATTSRLCAFGEKWEIVGGRV